jgi:hypothetical protein
MPDARSSALLEQLGQNPTVTVAGMTLVTDQANA